MSFFNPLKHVFETKLFPHSRALRTNFWGKVKDAMEVFWGKIIPDEKSKGSINPSNEPHFGVFDYLTLGISFGLNFLILIGMRQVGMSSSGLAWLGVGLCILAVVNIPRAVFAGFMTLLSLPFVGVAYAVSKQKSEAAKREILSYKLEDEKTRFHPVPSFLPDDLVYYKNSYVFIEDKNLLYYVDMNKRVHTLRIKDIEQFRNQLGINSEYLRIRIGLSYYKITSKQKIQSYLDEPKVDGGSYLTLGKILEARDAQLEEGIRSKIALQQDSAEITIQDKGGPLLSGFTLSWNNLSDITFFNNMRRLNIAKIEQVIETAGLESQLPSLH